MESSSSWQYDALDPTINAKEEFLAYDKKKNGYIGISEIKDYLQNQSNRLEELGIKYKILIFLIH